MMHRSSRLFASLAILIGCSGVWACPSGAPVVVVDAKASRLRLCADGAEAASFVVALGRGGIGKKRQGDHRTPLGVYALGSPRPSRRFHVFIPIAYPTIEQETGGFSGGDVGVHGPMFIFRWAGRLNTLFAWTDGCIAVGSNEEIDRIARWVNEKHPRQIKLE
jgi:murein L,D-transpeptidase YafK